MKKLLGIGAILLTILGIVSTVTQGGKDINEIYTKFTSFLQEKQVLSIELGMELNELNATLGEPNEVNIYEFIYLSKGIKIYPNSRMGQESVAGIVAEKLASGEVYKGYINKIKIGMSFKKITNIHGEPDYWDINLGKISIWADEFNFLIVEFDDNQKSKKITYARREAIAIYPNIVNIAIQELKAGRIPIFLDEMNPNQVKNINSTEENKENEPLSLKSFKKKFLNQNYKVISVEPAKYGGGIVYLYYTEKEKMLMFWIYPLSVPSIRGIMEIQK